MISSSSAPVGRLLTIHTPDRRSPPDGTGSTAESPDAWILGPDGVQVQPSVSQQRHESSLVLIQFVRWEGGW